MKTIGSVLKRLLLALGGSASENYLNDITLVDRIADLAEDGQIAPSAVQGVYNLHEGTAIPANADLDTYTTQGIYYSGPAANAQTFLNCPIVYGFKLVVMSTRSVGYILQIILRYDGTEEWRRYYNQATWSTWVKTVSSLPLAIKDGGTGAEDVANARTNLGLPYYELPSGGGTLSFSAENGTRFLMFTASSVDAYRGMYIFNTPNAGGTLTYSAVLNASSVVITPGNNSFTVRMGAAGFIGFLVFGGSLTKV